MNVCENVVTINCGVAVKSGILEGEFKGQTFDLQARTLGEILHDSNMESINFVKMDVEGAEWGIAPSSIEELSKVVTIAVERHNARNELDVLFTKRFFIQNVMYRFNCESACTVYL